MPRNHCPLLFSNPHPAPHSHSHIPITCPGAVLYRKRRELQLAKDRLEAALSQAGQVGVFLPNEVAPCCGARVLLLGDLHPDYGPQWGCCGRCPCGDCGLSCLAWPLPCLLCGCFTLESVPCVSHPLQEAETIAALFKELDGLDITIEQLTECKRDAGAPAASACALWQQSGGIATACGLLLPPAHSCGLAVGLRTEPMLHHHCDWPGLCCPPTQPGLTCSLSCLLTLLHVHWLAQAVTHWPGWLAHSPSGTSPSSPAAMPS